MTFASAAEAATIRAGLVASGAAAESVEYPGRLALVGWPSGVVPGSRAHRRLAANVEKMAEAFLGCVEPRAIGAGA